MKPPKPSLQSFLIADKVIQEKGTNKWSVIGIFDRILARNFPLMYYSLAPYIRLGEAEGEYDIKVEFCDEAGRILSVFEGLKLVVHSKLVTPELGIQTYNLPLPRPGKYFFRLYFNGEFFKDFPIEAQLVS